MEGNDKIDMDISVEIKALDEKPLSESANIEITLSVPGAGTVKVTGAPLLVTDLVDSWLHSFDSVEVTKLVPQGNQEGDLPPNDVRRFL